MLRTTLKKYLSGIGSSRVFERGAAYARDGRVHSMDESDGVSAVIQGTRQYSARLWEDGRRLKFECSCPVGREGNICKHCVALGVVWLSVGKTKGARKSKRDLRRETQRLSILVDALDRRSLKEMVLSAAKRDKTLQQRLLLLSADKADGMRALEEWKAQFRRAADPGGYISWNEMSDFADGMIEVLRGLDEWLEVGRFETVADLCEWAIGVASDAVSYCDDDGDLDRVFTRLGTIHLRACKLWNPDPMVLEKRLRTLEESDQSGIFYDVRRRYKRLLRSTPKPKRTRALRANRKVEAV